MVSKILFRLPLFNFSTTPLVKILLKLVFATSSRTHFYFLLLRHSIFENKFLSINLKAFSTSSLDQAGNDKHEQPRAPSNLNSASSSTVAQIRRMTEMSPAPNAYVLPRLIGSACPVKKSSAAFSLTSRQSFGSYLEDFHKVSDFIFYLFVTRVVESQYS